jgi:hypothetical protein
MRREQQARFLEIRHDVADRGRREIEPAAPRQGARADRLAGLDISIDDHAENLAAPLVELADRRLRQLLRHRREM